jgi:hypothetical protein
MITDQEGDITCLIVNTRSLILFAGLLNQSLVNHTTNSFSDPDMLLWAILCNDLYMVPFPCEQAIIVALIFFLGKTRLPNSGTSVAVSMGQG